MISNFGSNPAGAVVVLPLFRPTVIEAPAFSVPCRTSSSPVVSAPACVVVQPPTTTRPPITLLVCAGASKTRRPSVTVMPTHEEVGPSPLAPMLIGELGALFALLFSVCVLLQV